MMSHVQCVELADGRECVRASWFADGIAMSVVAPVSLFDLPSNIDWLKQRDVPSDLVDQMAALSSVCKKG